MRRTPSLRGLQAFEAVARTGNLSGAAAALGISPSAVSHRIRGLEAELGVGLLRRTTTGLALTEAGRRYRPAITEAFAAIAAATVDLLGPDLSRPLTISLVTEFGFRWLMPRFHRFLAEHPDIEIAVVSAPQLADLAAGEADMALRYGEGVWPGLCAEPIMRFGVSPVCAPALAERIRGQPLSDAMSSVTLIRCAYDDWETWLEAAGAAEVRPLRQLRFTSFSMAATAAIGGEGLLLGYTGYVEAELERGVLVRPYELTVPLRTGYHLVYPEERLRDPRVRAFRDWVIAERAPAGEAPPA